MKTPAARGGVVSAVRLDQQETSHIEIRRSARDAPSVVHAGRRTWVGTMNRTAGCIWTERNGEERATDASFSSAFFSTSVNIPASTAVRLTHCAPILAPGIRSEKPGASGR